MLSSRIRRWRSSLALALVVAGLSVPVAAAPASAAADPCAPVVNPTVCENSKPGTPSGTWDVAGAGSDSIQGYPTDISVNVGDTQRFKVDTTAASYKVDIYRMGYYGGNGARLIRHGQPGRPAEPAGLPLRPVDRARRLRQLGLSASWTVPTTAVSGIYFARLSRTDGTAGASQVVFRRPRRLQPLQPAVPDLRRDLAGLQHLRRQQPVRRFTGRACLQGELQPADHHPRHRRRGHGLQRRVPDGAVPRVQRLRRQLPGRHRHRPARRAAAQPPRVPVRRPRRILVRHPAGQRRGRP